MTLNIRPRTAALLVAALALAPAGCLNPNLFPPAYYPYGPYPPPQYPPAPAPPPADKSTPPTVDNRNGGPPTVTRAQFQQAGDPQQLPPPNQLPIPVPPGPGAGPTDPHRRGDPTAYGKDLRLGPNEIPLDRALELAKRIDELLLEQRQALARIRTLESQGRSREQALDETVRDVEVATAEVVKARNDMQALRNELVALRDKVKQVERDELDTLRKVIAALEKLLDTDK